MYNQKLAQIIDHTLLKPEATQIQIEKLCEEAITYQFAAVCVNPTWVSLVAQKLTNSNVKTCTVIGFPLGASTTKTKLFEATDALEAGATELDLVLNLGALKSLKYNLVQDEIQAFVELAHPQAIVKIIIETCLLSESEKIKACELSVAAGADFVKTSTGFSSGGATIADVSLLRNCVGNNALVKASGGIRDYATATAMITAGADRLGTSASVAIIHHLGSSSQY